MRGADHDSTVGPVKPTTLRPGAADAHPDTRQT
jgi:hypothetical protein